MWTRHRPIIISALLLLGWIGCLALASWWQRRQIVLPVSRDHLIQSRILGDYTYQSSASGSARPNLGIVYGFLPYWSVDDYQIDPSVSHVSYFRLAVDAKGNVTADAGKNIYQSERMQQVFDQITRQNLQLEVTFFTSYSDDIYQFMRCESCQEHFIDQALAVVAADRLDGINLDFEYLGTLTDDERQQVTMFLYRLKNRLLDQFPRTKLSISVYGGAANMTSNLYDFAKINQIVDRVIIMGYDYKTRQAETPGSSSPTLGGNIWNGGIWDDVISMRRFIDADKIILAVPFYGYAWETTTCELATAKTYPDTGQTLTYRGAQNILNDRAYNAKEYWDENSLTPYLVYRSSEDESGEERCHIGFFENERSINYKINLIDQLGLGGIAIWALGYEGDYPELWQTIATRFAL